MRLAIPIVAALVLAASQTATAAAVPPRAHAATARDWTATVTRTPDGAFVLGNPAARVRLVEYMSYTCPHCAAFEVEGAAALRQRFIATGKVSWEVRHALRDAFDTTAAMLARCDPQRFFPLSHAIMAQQEAWLGRAAGYDPAAHPAASDAASLAGIAHATGLDAIAAAAGIPPARQAACLGSAPALAELGAMRQEAWTTRGIAGTPAFFIGGIDQKTTQWSDLAPRLAAAVR